MLKPAPDQWGPGPLKGFRAPVKGVAGLLKRDLGLVYVMPGFCKAPPPGNSPSLVALEIRSYKKGKPVSNGFLMGP